MVRKIVAAKVIKNKRDEKEEKEAAQKAKK
jgi:hypothetical protein